MTQNAPFSFKIPEGYRIELNQEATFENFIGQFQQYCPKILCIVDGTSLRYYDKTDNLPPNIKFDYKQIRGGITEYYFRDIYNNSSYCVFGRDSARMLYPNIDTVDPNIENKRPAIIQSLKPSLPMFRESKITSKPKDSSNNIIIIDRGVKHIFSNPNYPVEIKTYSPL